MPEAKNITATDSAAAWVVACGERYWPGRAAPISALAMPRRRMAGSAGHRLVMLPDWARDLGVGGALLVNDAAIAPGPEPEFFRCDWLAACFFHLTGAAESGRTDSYSALTADPRLFDHAWVNRIFLLLRRMAARHAGQQEEALFGPLPQARIHLTHDVDAIIKTLEVRCKQTAFHLFNTARALTRLQFRRAVKTFAQAIRFAVTTPAYGNFALVRRLEEEHGLRSIFHFYGGPAGRKRGSLRRMLMDPGYDVAALRGEMALLRAGGWRIGLHPSFDAWDDAAAMTRERQAVEAASAGPVDACRQHWLRFDWARSWRAQQAAGMALDSTLGFNNRSGFRNGAALCFHPWDGEAPLAIRALPMLLMDSHFYDYAPMSDAERRAALARWIGEVRAVGGEVSVNWHVHTLAPDYGWEGGFRDLLKALA